MLALESNEELSQATEPIFSTTNKKYQCKKATLPLKSK